MSDLFKLLIVGIYLYLVYKFKNNTKLLLLFTLVTILILCNINKIYEGYKCEQEGFINGITEGYSDGSVEQHSPVDFDDVNNFSDTFNRNGSDPVKETIIPETNMRI